MSTVPRTQALEHDVGFRTVHAFLFNSAGEILLQQLAPERARNPLRWGSSVAAYLHAGESYGAAIARRLLEELGVDLPLVAFGKTEMRDRGSRKFVMLYTGRIEAVPQIREPDHIARLEFFSLDEVDRESSRNQDRFTESFLHLWEFFGDRSHSHRATG